MTMTRQGEQADVVLQLFDKDGTEHRLVLTADQARQAKAELAELEDEEPAAEHPEHEAPLQEPHPEDEPDDEDEELKKLEEPWPPPKV
jgi:hypothetical protein